MRLSRLLIAWVFLGLTLGFSYGDNTQKNGHPKPKNKIEKQKDITPQSVIISQPITAFVQKDESQKKETDGEWKTSDTINSLLVAITAILAAFTGGLFFKTKNLAESAIDQGSISKKQIEVMEDTAKRELRAYVVAEGGSQENVSFEVKEGIASIIFLPAIINTGKTPAHKVRHFSDAIIQQFPIPESFKYPSVPENAFAFTSLGPGRKVGSISKMIKLPIKDFQALMVSKTEKIHVFGIVTYEDIFGHEWYTEFSYLIGMGWIQIKGGARILNCKWRNTPDHNGST